MEKVLAMNRDDDMTLDMQVQVGSSTISSFLDTGSTASIVSKNQVPSSCKIVKGSVTFIRVANNQVLTTDEYTMVDVLIGDEKRSHKFLVLDTLAFHSVVGMDFFKAHTDMKYIGFFAQDSHFFWTGRVQCLSGSLMGWPGLF